MNFDDTTASVIDFTAAIEMLNDSHFVWEMTEALDVSAGMIPVGVVMIIDRTGEFPPLTFNLGSA